MKRSKPTLWVLAGGNGAGKTTFYNLYLAACGITFVNADLIAKNLNPENPEDYSYQAATLAAEIRENLLLQRISFCYETVFSHPSKIDFISKAKAMGYQINFVYIHLIDSSLNEARVTQRVTEGGHRVPAAKIHSRIPRTMQHIKPAISIADQVLIFDNSSWENPFQKIISIRNGNYQTEADSLPEWVKDLLPLS